MAQIAIAQSEDDEQRLIDFLTERFDLLCLSRVMPATPTPSRLGSLEDQRQVIFPGSSEDLVLSSIVPVVEGEGDFQIRPGVGLVIEWNRTERSGTGHSAGRFYLRSARKPLSVQAYAEATRLYSVIARQMRTTAGARSEGPRTVYVGPDLASRLERGEADLAHPSGMPVDVATGPGSS